MVIQFNIPDAVVQRAVDGMCLRLNYEANKLVGESQGAFVKRMTVKWWKGMVAQAEADAAIRVADDSARASVETEIVIT